MKRIHVSGISIFRIIERHKIFQGLKWTGDINFPDMSNILVVEKNDGSGGIIIDHDSFGGRASWAYFEGESPLIGKDIGGLDPEESKFLKENYPALHRAITNLDA